MQCRQSVAIDLLVLLIGLELIQTVKAYLDDDVIHVDLVVLVAIIAIARKIIVWDIGKYSYLDLLSLAAMTTALGVTYFLIKRAKFSIPLSPRESRDE